MINSALSSFVIHVKVLQVVVKVDGACAEVSAQEGGVGGEDGGDVNVPFPTERNS